MSGRVRISVITVVRNGARNLEETILSVIEKKKTVELDYLVIDGGSTDGTVDIIRKYAELIAYWVSEQDAGIYDAMNKGWIAASADSFILFLGAGDRLITLPDKIDCYARNEVIHGSVLMGEKYLFSSRAGFHLKLYNSLHHQALLVNKACHPAPPFDIRYRIFADFDFNQRLMKMGARFVHSPQLLCYARPGGLSDEQNFRESLQVISNNFGFIWMLLAVAGYGAMKMVPFLQRLRPIKET